jgi:hypothetical protein
MQTFHKALQGDVSARTAGTSEATVLCRVCMGDASKQHPAMLDEAAESCAWSCSSSTWGLIDSHMHWMAWSW